MVRFLALGALLLATASSCSSRPASAGVYYWKTTLDWSDTDSRRLADAGVDRLGLRLFDWGPRGPEGPLVVRSPVPGGLEVVPVVYITTARLEAWASAFALDPRREAGLLLDRMDAALAPSWAGQPRTWQLDADWTARTRAAWFAVAAAFGESVHGRGGRFEVTLRLHQYRDRAAQGVPPADGVVLMLYGAGDAVLDRALVASYLSGPPYPLPLVPAFPDYTQVRQLNGYGRLVALHRVGAELGPEAGWPTADLKALGADRWEVVRRTTLGGRTLLAHDVLAVDRVDPAVLGAVRALPAVRALVPAANDRVWVFDYDPKGWEALVHGPLAPHLFPR